MKTTKPSNRLEEIKSFVDIPEGWLITKKVKKSLHHQDCSWVKASMLCDCGVLQGAIEMRKMDHQVFRQAVESALKSEREEYREALHKRHPQHWFFYWKEEDFECCIKCGNIRQIKKDYKNAICRGWTKLTLRFP